MLSTAFALHFTGQYMLQLYNNFQKNSSDGDTSALPEVHATRSASHRLRKTFRGNSQTYAHKEPRLLPRPSAGLKALVTELAANGIERCRLSCGGHGYHHYRSVAPYWPVRWATRTLTGCRPCATSVLMMQRPAAPVPGLRERADL